MSEPRRVLLVSLWLESGGTERQLAGIAQALDRARFSPFVGCLRLKGMRVAELRAAGVPLEEFPVKGLYRLSHWRSARRLGAYIHEHRIDIVHAFDVPGTLFAVPPARWYRTPLVLSSQRAFRALTPRYRPLLRLTDRFAHGVVVNSRAVGRELAEREGVPEEKIHYCPNGLDAATFYPPAERAGAAPVVGIVAMLRPEKNIETLVDAFAAARAVAAGAQLAIVGSGERESALKRRAADLELGDRCRFEPASRDVAGWLRRFDVFVLPSLSESSSNSLMEAMACGCCAIASRVGGNPELVEDGVTGLLFESGNAADLAAKLRLALGDAALRARLGGAAALRMRGEFSLLASARRMEEIYDTLLARGAKT